MNEGRIVVTADNRLVRLRDDGTWEAIKPARSGMEALRSVRQSPEALEFFRGLFDRAGVRTLDTGEAFTCVQSEDGIEFIDGVDEDAVDFTVEVFSYQVERLASSLEMPTLDEVEQFRIVRSLYRPAAAAGLNNPAVRRFMNNPLISLLIRRRHVVHITLASPSPGEEPDALYTLLKTGGQWLLLEGRQGTAQRTFRVTHTDALDMNRRMMTALRTGGWREWLRLAAWYRAWRGRVEAG